MSVEMMPGHVVRIGWRHYRSPKNEPLLQIRVVRGIVWASDRSKMNLARQPVWNNSGKTTTPIQGAGPGR